WSEHLMMVTITLAGKLFLLVNIYTPSEGAARVRYYKAMQEIKMPSDATVICGGDFNCILLKPLDRSKGGDTSDPVNYRLIALHNSDYKLFTRILARRFRNTSQTWFTIHSMASYRTGQFTQLSTCSWPRKPSSNEKEPISMHKSFYWTSQKPTTNWIEAS
ncbi:Reverse transcriptase precursor, partial [Phytophthora megakarya]